MGSAQVCMLVNVEFVTHSVYCSVLYALNGVVTHGFTKHKRT